MRNTLLLVWWILTPLMVILTLVGPRLAGDEAAAGQVSWVGVLMVVASFLWIGLTLGLVFTRQKQQSSDS